MLLQGIVGPQSVASIGSGTPTTARFGQLSDAIVSELHGRFYETTYRGNMYSGGLTTLTALANANFTVANGLSATLATAAASTPIIGLYNPASSTINAAIHQATLAITQTNLTATGAGGFVWAVFANNPSVSTGATPISRKTLTAVGSQCKTLANVALTGLSNVGVALAASALNGGIGYNISSVATASGFTPPVVTAVENLDGSLIIPPGGVLALYATTTPAALSAVGSLLWEEIPV